MNVESKTFSSEETIRTLTRKIDAKSENIKDWNRAIQFAFTDAEPYWIKITAGKVEKVEKALKKQEAAVTVTCSVESLQKIIDGKMNSVQALITRKVKVDGPVLIIRELRQKVLGDFKYQ
jgi:putative sterol carrier protein